MYGFFICYQVRDKLAIWLELPEQLQVMWEEKNKYLQQLPNEQALLPAACQLGNLSTSEEVSQSTSLSSNSIDKSTYHTMNLTGSLELLECLTLSGRHVTKRWHLLSWSTNAALLSLCCTAASCRLSVWSAWSLNSNISIYVIQIWLPYTHISLCNPMFCV